MPGLNRAAYKRLCDDLLLAGRNGDLAYLDGTLWDRAVDLVDDTDNGYAEDERQERVAREALRLWHESGRCVSGVRSGRGHTT